ncbi:SufBD protein [Desulfonatronospira thiodismutans ASO3-1]|uniref:SufBD protein n=1 Tax=Desulfonatronospira thiodismutans ASO3-1 TaxID=555779 RepID=D6SUB8_9BACT|nr:MULTISPECIES: SufD family Fe-S cluster assembly protein [Desulfonatronospira]EFI32898.1 SufBD protein [Desulfonatronospira thiodismutans ASO3-1]RQD79225.1 MAG: SufD family Fe-S cluster assembly protein [Desulfonatronospira sp. MSAO_Bac3]
MSQLNESETPRVDLGRYSFDQQEQPALKDLRQLSEADRKQLLMAGVDTSEAQRSGSYLHVNHSKVHCSSCQKGVEILDIKEALDKYDGLPEYYWQAVDKDKDEFTRAAAEKVHGGYFIRTEKGAKITDPVQSCLFIKGENVGQNVHNIIIVEEDSELHVITGCTTSADVTSALHLGISEIYIKKGGKLTFTMVHNWGSEVMVRPRTVAIVQEDGVFASNYILLRPVRSVQSFPAVFLNGERAVASFNSILVAPKGSYIDSGNKIVLNAPDTRGEIISRTITTGGTIIAPGIIEGNTAPAKGHLECKGLVLSEGIIHAIPELKATVPGVELSHEAAVGKIAQEEIEYLMARGLDEEQATSTIVRGFMNVDIMGLPAELQASIEEIIDETEKDMF